MDTTMARFPIRAGRRTWRCLTVKVLAAYHTFSLEQQYHRYSSCVIAFDLLRNQHTIKAVKLQGYFPNISLFFNT